MVIQKNRYFRRSKLSEAKLRQILRYFAMDLTATDCAELSGVSVRSINTIYHAPEKTHGRAVREGLTPGR